MAVVVRAMLGQFGCCSVVRAVSFGEWGQSRGGAREGRGGWARSSRLASYRGGPRLGQVSKDV